MKVYTFWCEYDLGINKNIYKDETVLRKEVSEALSNNGVDGSLHELEEDGLFSIESQEV